MNLESFFGPKVDKKTYIKYFIASFITLGLTYIYLYHIGRFLVIYIDLGILVWVLWTFYVIVPIAITSLIAMFSFVSLRKGYIFGGAVVAISFLISLFLGRLAVVPRIFQYNLNNLILVIIMVPVLFYARKIFISKGKTGLKIAAAIFITALISLFVYAYFSTCSFGNDESCIYEKKIAEIVKEDNLEACLETGLPRSYPYNCINQIALKQDNRSICKYIAANPYDLPRNQYFPICIEETSKDPAFDKWLLDELYLDSENEDFRNCYQSNSGKVEETINCIKIENPQYYNSQPNYIKFLGY